MTDLAKTMQNELAAFGKMTSNHARLNRRKMKTVVRYLNEVAESSGVRGNSLELSHSLANDLNPVAAEFMHKACSFRWAKDRGFFK
jgi:hypothetical protein